MKIVDEEEAIQWLTARGITDSSGRVLPQNFARQATYPIPEDSGAKTAIARSLALIFAEFDEWMIWIDEFGIWPSSENRYLFDMFRQSLGEKRNLIDSQGHILTPSDTDVGFALLSMALYFIWGVVVASPSGELVVRISHHECADVYAKETNELSDDLFNTFA